MKALHLLRHAKSSWDDPSLDDFDRPLAARGRRAAKKLGDYLRTAGIEPALVLCSPARRTIATLEHLGPLEGEVRLELGLYGASADELLAVVRTAPAHVPSIMVIGHNPGLQKLAVRFAAAGDARQIERMREKMPTGALACFDVDAKAWDAVSPGSGRLVGYVVPKEL
jgi:phosphohistidine phosphatase